MKLALSYPKSDKRRKEQFTKIRKMATFNHNMVVLEYTHLVPTMLPCKKCNTFFHKHELARHATTCMSKNGEQKKVSLKQNETRRTSLAGFQKRDRMQ